MCKTIFLTRFADRFADRVPNNPPRPTDEFDSPTIVMWSAGSAEGDLEIQVLLRRITPTAVRYGDGDRSDSTFAATRFSIAAAVRHILNAAAATSVNQLALEYNKRHKEEFERAVADKVKKDALAFCSLFEGFDPSKPQLPHGYVLLRPAACVAPEVMVENTALAISSSSSEADERKAKRIRLRSVHDDSHHLTSSKLLAGGTFRPNTLDYELVAGDLNEVNTIADEFVAALVNPVILQELPHTRLLYADETEVGPRSVREFAFTTCPDLTAVLEAIASDLKRFSLAKVLKTARQEDAEQTDGGLDTPTVDAVADAGPDELLVDEFNLYDINPIRILAESDSAGGILFFYNALNPDVARLNKMYVDEVNSVLDEYNRADYEAPPFASGTTTQIRTDNRTTDWLRRGIPSVGLNDILVSTNKRDNAAFVMRQPRNPVMFGAVTLRMLKKIFGGSPHLRMVPTPSTTALKTPKIQALTDAAAVRFTKPANTQRFRLNLLRDEGLGPALTSGAIEDEEDAFDSPAKAFEIDLHYRSPEGYKAELKQFVKLAIEVLLAKTAKPESPDVVGTLDLASGSTPKEGIEAFVFRPHSDLIRSPEDKYAIEQARRVRLTRATQSDYEAVYPRWCDSPVSSASLSLYRYAVEQATTPFANFHRSPVYDRIASIVGSATPFAITDSADRPIAKRMYTAVVGRLCGAIDSGDTPPLHLIQYEAASGSNRLGALAQGFEPLVIEMGSIEVVETDDGSLGISYSLGSEATTVMEAVMVVAGLLTAVVASSEGEPEPISNSKVYPTHQHPTVLQRTNSDLEVKEGVPIAQDLELSAAFAPSASELLTTRVDLKPYYAHLGVTAGLINKAGHVVLGAPHLNDAHPSLGTAPGHYHATMVPNEPFRVSIENMAGNESTDYDVLSVKSLAEFSERRSPDPLAPDTTSVKNTVSIPLCKRDGTSVVGYITLDSTPYTVVPVPENDMSANFNSLGIALQGNRVSVRIFDHTSFKAVSSSNAGITVEFEGYAGPRNAGAEPEVITYTVKEDEAATLLAAYEASSAVPGKNTVHTKVKIGGTDEQPLTKRIEDMLVAGCNGFHHSNTKALDRTVFASLIGPKRKMLQRWLDTPDFYGEAQGIRLSDERDPEAALLVQIRDGERNRTGVEGSSIQFGGRGVSAMVVPVIALVKGPGLSALTTACRVDDYAAKSSVYRLIETSAIRRLQNRLAEFQRLPPSAHCRCVAKYLPRLANPTLKKLVNQRREVAPGLAKLMLLLYDANRVMTKSSQGYNRSSLGMLETSIGESIDHVLFLA